jgi:hypothetical protein
LESNAVNVPRVPEVCSRPHAMHLQMPTHTNTHGSKVAGKCSCSNLKIPFLAGLKSSNLLSNLSATILAALIILSAPVPKALQVLHKEKEQ